MKITKNIAKKVLSIVDQGLSNGVGKPNGDNPSCVSPVLRSFKIALNDKGWSSNAARAKGLRRIAIAQLGTRDTLDEQEFIKRLAILTVKKTVPAAIRLVAEKAPEPHKEKMLAAALRCEQEGTREAAINANKIVKDHYYAAYAAANADAAAAAAYAAAAATYAAYAADAAAAAYAAAYAAAADAAAANAANAADAADARDKVLAEYAEDVVQILIELKTPGSKYLSLTE